MATESMTLYQALTRKKILEDKVSKMRSLRMVEIIDSSGKNKENMTSEEIEKIIRSNYSSTIANMKNLGILKAAINDTNAVVNITVAGKTYSIANAIARFRNLDSEEAMYKRMRDNIIGMKAEIAEHNEEKLSPEKISAYVQNVLGDSKKDDKLVQSVTESYRKDNSLTLFDPLDTETLAEEALADIDKFREEIHFALTKVNCETMITVEFVD